MMRFLPEGSLQVVNLLQRRSSYRVRHRVTKVSFSELVGERRTTGEGT